MQGKEDPFIQDMCIMWLWVPFSQPLAWALLCSVQSCWWESLSCHQVWINVDSPLKNNQQCSSHSSGGRARKWEESFLHKSWLLPRCSHKIELGLVLQRVSTCQPVKWHVVSRPCPAWWGNLFTGLLVSMGIPRSDISWGKPYTFSL